MTNDCTNTVFGNYRSRGEDIAAGLVVLRIKTDVLLRNPSLTEYIVNNRLLQALYGQSVTV
jgi:hypothetical protein